LIDGDGVARLDCIGGTNSYLFLESGTEVPDGSFSAREGRDVYGIGMIIYEASFHCPGPMPNLTFF